MIRNIALFSIFLVAFATAQGPMMVQPKLLSQQPPEYPDAAKRLRLEGKVYLNAQIGSDGTVRETQFAQAHFTYGGKSVEIASPADIEKMDPAYKETAKSMIASSRSSALTWKFAPAKIGGEPIDATIVIPFTFKLTIQPQKSSPERPVKKK